MAKVNLRAKLLEKKIQKASKDYYENSESSVSDAEFDRDQKELKEISPDSPVLQQIGADEEGLRKVEHTIPMGSLENCMNVPEVLKWAKGFSESMVLSRKVDGASLSLYYEDGVLQEATTRGNGKIGADVMFSIQHLPDIQMLESPYTGHVRGECYLKKSNFDDINKKKLERGEEPFKNPRNAASGIMRNEDTEFAIYLDFLAFDLPRRYIPGIDNMHDMFQKIYDLGLESPYLGKIPRDQLDSAYSSEISGRENLDYCVDGLVLAVNDFDMQEKMGGTDKYPKWARALKFPAEEVVTRLLGVTFSLGHTGALIPTGNLNPIDIAGTTVSNALLCNIEEVERLGIKIGHNVIVSKRGDIIPKIERVHYPHDGCETTDIVFPTNCPYCEKPTKRVGVNVCCVNDECDERRVRRLVSFASKSKMDIMHLGDKSVREIYRLGIHSVKDLLSEKVSAKFLSDALGENGLKIHKSIEKIKDKQAHEFVGSLGIPDLGSRRVKEIVLGLNISSAEQLLNLTEKDILNLPRFKSTLARKVVKGIEEAKEEIKAIPKECTWVQNSKSTEKGSVVFTGKVEATINGERATRKMLTELAENNGYDVASGVSSSVTYLVQADPTSQSTKTKKANKLGVKIISDVEFLQSIGVSE